MIHQILWGTRFACRISGKASDALALQFTGKDLPIRHIEVSQERYCELVTIDLFTTANPSFGGSIQRHRQRNRAGAELFRKIFWLVIHIYSDADDRDVRRVFFSAHFDENPGNFFPSD